MGDIRFIGIFFFKIMCLLAGSLSIYWGYRLFMNQITAQAGNLHLKHSLWELSLKEAAPGIFFSLFGAIIVLITILKGFTSIKRVGPRKEKIKIPFFEDIIKGITGKRED